ncbi:segregation protein B [Alloacidobacterium dinghuense]|uniref:Segregation protein B n=1 Tax=Alloacidobacterium dinghuense TaxID=2763107 RepID=A0A7G8BJC5_9BACT|nr:Asd/ArgC dimerization domain-containing protein [Alloacidobacterium dinghuense]QNI32645.1 segregation protein B [Alloacidobacterium dinghuense]
MPDTYKIAIVGASSLRGKELNDALSESPFGSADFLLMDDEATLGQLESVGDEVTFIQRIEPSSFAGVDFAFFAGSQEVTRKHWHNAQKASASIIDMSYALESEPRVLVRAPWVQDETREEVNGEATESAPDLQTPAVVPAHPAAVALALLLLRAKGVAGVRSASATVLEPASEYGRASMDELHQQTVSLLSFQSLPKEMYDAQVAFNLLPSLGEAAKVHLGASEARIRRHYDLLSAGHLPEVMIQLLHAPVFHGYGISLALTLDEPVSLEHLEAALSGEHVDVVLGDSDPPSNLSSAGQDDILVRARTADGSELATRRFWVWAALDNLKLTATNALACAQELRKLRPQGKVQ